MDTSVSRVAALTEASELRHHRRRLLNRLELETDRSDLASIAQEIDIVETRIASLGALLSTANSMDALAQPEPAAHACCGETQLDLFEDVPRDARETTGTAS